MATIRLPTRIAHATDDEESARYALLGTLVTPEGFAFATDGHFAACVKVKVQDLDAPTMIPQELGPTSKADLKAEYTANGELKCEKHSIVKGQPRVEQATIRDGRFPKVGEILQAVEAGNALVLAVNANYLWRLAQAINVPDTPAAAVVTLLVPKPDENGVVTGTLGVLSNHDSLHGQDAAGFGVLMPCDADAAQVRKDFVKFRNAASASLDAAATNWNERGIERPERGEETPTIKKAEKVPKPADASSTKSTKSQTSRKSTRNQRVA